MRVQRGGEQHGARGVARDTERKGGARDAPRYLLMAVCFPPFPISVKETFICLLALLALLVVL